MTHIETPVSSIVSDIAAGKKSSVDLVKQSIARIEAANPEINGFISVQKEAALVRADALDRLSPDAKRKLPLLGIPIGVKDNMCTADVTTTCGSRMLKNFVPPYTATAVLALENAGAVVIGKTNMDEFAMGSSTENSFFGVTRNPADPTRIPGGSSGGSAAVVAADMVPLSLGSDTGGSIRSPASHCGVIGLKPTYGRVSRYGLVAFASSLDQIGPIGKCAKDVGLMLQTISAPDSFDATNCKKKFIDDPTIYSGDLRGMTIGIPREYFGDGLSSDVRTPIESLIEKFRLSGVKFVDVSLPNVKYAIATYYVICTAEASSNLARYDGVKYGFRSEKPDSLIDMYTDTRAQGFGAEVKRRIMLGTYVLSAGYYDAFYLKAAKVRTLIGNDFTAAFSQCDALLSPVAPTPAFTIGEKSSDPLQMYLTDIYTVSANLAGIPAISVPCNNGNGLPVGVQFMAAKWREDTLLKLAHGVESLS